MQLQKVVNFVLNTCDKVCDHGPYLDPDQLKKLYQKLCIIEDIILEADAIMGVIEGDSAMDTEDADISK